MLSLLFIIKTMQLFDYFYYLIIVNSYDKILYNILFLFYLFLYSFN